jgi:DNA polymerase-3 subunit epsilon
MEGAKKGRTIMSSKSYLNAFVRRVSNPPFFVLDTETTGLYNAQIVQIALIDHEGKPLLNTLVKPTEAIPAAARAIHHITDEMVADAPSWFEVRKMVLQIVKEQTVVIYNSSYDVGVMRSSDSHNGLEPLNWYKDAAKEWFCAMNAYAVHYGDWNSRHNSYTWKPLIQAANSFNVPTVNAHSALGDCLMTLGVVRGLIAHYASKDKADA